MMPSIRRVLFTLLLCPLAVAEAQELAVVTTLPVYESITAEIAGGRAQATAISRSDENAHFVKPKPSFALMLKRADLFVTTGLDLELWAPVLIDKSGNRTIRTGQDGYVSASENVPLADIPEVADRSGGDVHIYGNPHIFTSPLNVKLIAANIARGLARVDPGGASVYQANLEDFQQRIDEALYGPVLIKVLDSKTLDPLARQDKLIPFLRDNEYQGRPLIDLLGGWLGEGLAFRERSIVAYHKNWVYFTELFGLNVVDYVEPKPGIPPSARHVHQLIEKIKAQNIRVILAASYFSPRQIESIAERTGCKTVAVPLSPGGSGPADYFSLVDLWVDSLVTAFE